MILPACSGDGDERPNDTDATTTGDDGPDTSDRVDPSGGVSFTNVADDLVALPSGVTGVSFADYDRDGRPDITFADRGGVRLYHNEGSGTFSPGQGLPSGPDGAIGVVWADVDGDGLLDLFVTTREGPDRLVRQTDVGFEDITAGAGLGVDTFGESATFGDLDGDGDLDLIIAQGFTRTLGQAGDGTGDLGNPNLAYRNEGGVFTDATDDFGLRGPETGETFLALIVDLDDDGDQDVIEIHDHIADHRFTNRGDGTFDSETIQNGEPTSLMGLDAADFDGDGRVDVYGTTAGKDILYLNTVEDGLRDEHPATIGSGFDPSATLTGWGAVFIDADNDADLDVMTVAAYQQAYDGTGTRPGRLVLMQHEERQDGPRALVDVSETSGAVFGPTLNGWGLAVADYDGDGDDDSAIPEGDTPHEAPLLLQNDSPAAVGKSALRIDLSQPGVPNHLAVGATVTVEIPDRSVTRVVTAGHSYASQSEYTLHFGLADNSRANVVRVRWPWGPVALWGGLKAGTHVLERNDDASCCVDGACEALDEAACRQKISQALGFDTGCQTACERLDECGLLAEEGLDSVDECAADCVSDPPPADSLSCLADSDCEAAADCLE